MPLRVPEQVEKAGDAVIIPDFALLSLLVLGLDVPPVAAFATTVEADVIARPNPFRVPVAAVAAPSLPFTLSERATDLVAMWTDPISKSTSLHIALADSERGILEDETTEEASASMDHGAGEICFILGPRKDCIRNKEALLGPRVSSSSPT